MNEGHNRALYRVRSAGAGGNRKTSAQNELRQLQEQVTQLQQDLLMKNMECERATDQLNVLVSLVKR